MLMFGILFYRRVIVNRVENGEVVGIIEISENIEVEIIYGFSIYVEC